MASNRSAEKRARQAERRRVRNRSVRTRLRTYIKNFRRTLESGDTGAAESALRSTERELRKAASKGVVKKKWASRHVSRLARHLHKARSA